MATITNIQSTDLISNSRTAINNNFTNLNNDKIETSVIDTDTTLSANSDSKIPTQKAVKAYVDAQTLLNIQVETTTGTTHTLTTNGTQKVIVFVKGSVKDVAGGSEETVLIKYNGVTKDTIRTRQGDNNFYLPFAGMYTETPPSATANITVEASTATLAEVVIIVMKI